MEFIFMKEELEDWAFSWKGSLLFNRFEFDEETGF
jgi:hypothetical protein